jgi:hypothetical protein
MVIVIRPRTPKIFRTAVTIRLLCILLLWYATDAVPQCRLRLTPAVCRIVIVIRPRTTSLSITAKISRLLYILLPLVLRYVVDIVSQYRLRLTHMSTPCRTIFVIRFRTPSLSTFAAISRPRLWIFLLVLQYVVSTLPRRRLRLT